MGNGPNNEVLGARVTGEQRNRYEAAKEEEEDVGSNAEFLRRLIEDGLDVREKTIYERLGCEDRVGARLEAERGPEESRQGVIARFLREAVDARDRDELEELEVGEDLRERIEAAAEDDEPLDVTIRRLLREGVERVENENRNRDLTTRVASAIVIFFISGAPAFYAYGGEYDTALGMVLIFIFSAAFAEEVNRMFELLESTVMRMIRKIKP